MTVEEILSTEYSKEFDELRKKAMATSYYKYGPLAENVKLGKSKFIESLKIRLAKYEETGNTEFMVDVANMAMIEFMYPQHPNAHFRSTDSSESPGIHGVCINDLKTKSRVMEFR